MLNAPIPRLIYYNDARHYLMYRFDPPLSLHTLRRPVDELLGTGVDTLAFGLASGATFLHGSNVGNQWGEAVTEHSRGVMWWRGAKNLEAALAVGLDPLKVVIDRAHEKGMRLICSLRMNDPATASGPTANRYMLNRLKQEHPEFMIGESHPDHPHGATCLDFAVEQVRNERLAVMEEVCDRYGADGIEMDPYVRAFFKPSQIDQHTPLLTEFIRQVRALLDRIGSKRNQRLMLSARVHPREEANRAVGMDVRTWITEKLLDWVVPGAGGFQLDQEAHFGRLADICDANEVGIYPRLGQVPYDDRHHKTTIQMWRAAAMNQIDAGADGVYLSDIGWPLGAHQYDILRELADVDAYARQDKHYLTAQREAAPDPNAVPRHVPVILEEGATTEVPISVGDDVSAAVADGELQRVTLRVRIVQTGPKDRFRFGLNGTELALDPRNVSTYYGGMVSPTAARSGLPPRINTHYWFEFDVPVELIRCGTNTVNVTMDHNLAERVEDRVFHQAELLIEYKHPPVPTGGQM